jgi:hypothetical protein
MINLSNIQNHINGRMQQQYGYLFHPLASTGRDVKQTNALTHIDPESKKPDHEEHEAHGEKGQSITPDPVRKFTDVFKARKPDLEGSKGYDRMV